MRATKKNMELVPCGALMVFRWAPFNRPRSERVLRAVWEVHPSRKDRGRCVLDAENTVHVDAAWATLSDIDSDNLLEIYPQGTDEYDQLWAEVMKHVLQGDTV